MSIYLSVRNLRGHGCSGTHKAKLKVWARLGSYLKLWGRIHFHGQLRT